MRINDYRQFGMFKINKCIIVINFSFIYFQFDLIIFVVLNNGERIYCFVD
jgi:hypothetical protein